MPCCQGSHVGLWSLLNYTTIAASHQELQLVRREGQVHARDRGL